MKRKRGFTLIELLAVIVIIAIIALIATPLVLNTIENAKKGAFEQTLNGVVKAVDLYKAQIQMTEPFGECRYFSFGSDVTEVTVRDGKKYYPLKELSIKGSLPTEGEIKVCKDEILVDASDGSYSGRYEDEKLNVTKGDLASSDLTTPIIDIFNITSTTDKVIVTLSAHSPSVGGVIVNYYYKIDDGKYNKTTDPSYVFEKLKENQEYTITVMVENKSGITTKESVKKITTKAFGELTIKIDEIDKWTSSKNVTINGTTKEYKIEYKIRKYNEETKEIEESEFTEYTGTFKLDTMATTEYPILIIARYNDNGTYSNEKTYEVVNIDTTSPTNTKPVVNVSTTKPTSEASVVIRQADTESGLDESTIEYGYSTDNVNYKWQTSSELKKLTAGTKYYVKTKVTNNAGATIESEVTEYTPGEITTCNVAVPSGWATSKTVTITGVQTGAELQYQVGVTNENSWTTISSGGTVKVEENTSVYCRLWDGTTAGGTGTGIVEGIDNEKPNVPTSTIRYGSSTGSVRTNEDSWSNQTLWWGEFNSTDNGGSGIDHYEYSTGCTGTKSGDLSTSGYLYQNGTNDIYCIRAVDKVGNISEWSQPYYFKVDTALPQIVVKAYNVDDTSKVIQEKTNDNININEWKNFGYKFIIEANDNESGLSTYNWEWNESGNDKLDTTLSPDRMSTTDEEGVASVTHETSITVSGARYAKITMIDKAGNSRSVTLTVYIDTSNPTLSIDNVALTTNSATIAYSTADVYSGIEKVTCKYSTTSGNYTTNGVINNNECTLSGLTSGKTYYYQICVNDKAGNGPICQTGSTDPVEMTKPTITFTNTPTSAVNGYLESQVATISYISTGITSPRYFVKTTRAGISNLTVTKKCGTGSTPSTSCDVITGTTTLDANIWYEVSGNVKVTYNNYSNTTGTIYAAIYDGTNFIDPIPSGTLMKITGPANYTVKHYQMNTDMTNYTLVETETLSGKIGYSVTPNVKTYTGFTSPSTKSVTVSADGSTNVDYYYPRKQVVTTFYRNTSTSDTTTATQTFTYGVSGQSFSDKGWTRTGYTHIGWSESSTGTGAYSVLNGVYDSWINGYAPNTKLYAIWVQNPTITFTHNPSSLVNGYAQSSVATVTYSSVGLSSPVYYIRTTRAGVSSVAVMESCGTSTSPGTCSSITSTTNLTANTWYKISGNTKVTYNTAASSTATLYAYTYDGTSARVQISGTVPMIDAATPTVSLSAVKAGTSTAVSNGSWSSAGLNFTLTQVNVGSSGATIKYCKDTNNTCTPSTTVTSGSTITSYNTLAGIYYIRYQITSGVGKSSAVASYQAKVDTNTPTVSIVGKNTAGTTIASGSWSSTGINFTLTKGTTGDSGYTIKYCKDTANTCTPSTVATSGSAITGYNTLTGTYYIRYQIISGSGLSSGVGSYQAKVDTSGPSNTAPTVTQSSTDTKALIVTNKQTDGDSGLNASTLSYGYSTDNSTYTWQSSNTFSSLTAGTTYYFKTKIKNNAGIETISSAATGKIVYTGIAAGTYSAGATVRYAGVDWLVMKDNGSNVTLITKSNIGTGAYNSTSSVDYATSGAKTAIDNWFNSRSVLVADKNVGALIADSSTGYYARLPRSNELSASIPNSSGTPFWTMSSVNTAQVVVALKNGTSLYHRATETIYSRSLYGGDLYTKTLSAKKVEYENIPAFPYWTTLGVSIVPSQSVNNYLSSNIKSYEIYAKASLCDYSFGVTSWTVSSAGSYPVGDSTCKKYTTIYSSSYEEYGLLGYRAVITVKEK